MSQSPDLSYSAAIRVKLPSERTFVKPFQLIFNYARKYTWSLILTAFSMLALVGIQLLIPGSSNCWSPK